MTNDLQPCSDCGKPEAHEMHLDDPHGYENRFNPFECNYEASYEGEENGFVGSCDHHEFEDDAEKRADQFDHAYGRYMDDQMDRSPRGE